MCRRCARACRAQAHRTGWAASIDNNFDEYLLQSVVERSRGQTPGLDRRYVSTTKQAIKCYIIGDVGVGATCLAITQTTDTFPHGHVSKVSGCVRKCSHRACAVSRQLLNDCHSPRGAVRTQSVHNLRPGESRHDAHERLFKDRCVPRVLLGRVAYESGQCQGGARVRTSDTMCECACSG